MLQPACEESLQDRARCFRASCRWAATLRPCAHSKSWLLLTVSLPTGSKLCSQGYTLRILAQYSLAAIFLKHQANGWWQKKPVLSLAICDLVEFVLLVTGGNAGVGWLWATLVEMWVGLGKEALAGEGCRSGNKIICTRIIRKCQINLNIQLYLDVNICARWLKPCSSIIHENKCQCWRRANLMLI